MADFLDSAEELWKSGRANPVSASFGLVFKGITALQAVHAKLRPAAPDAIPEAVTNKESSHVGSAYVPLLKHRSRHGCAAHAPTLAEPWKERPRTVYQCAGPHR